MKKEMIVTDKPLRPVAVKAHHGWLRPAAIILLLAAAGVIWYLNSIGREAAPVKPGAMPNIPETTVAPEPQTARQRRETARECSMRQVPRELFSLS